MSRADNVEDVKAPNQQDIALAPNSEANTTAAVYQEDQQPARKRRRIATTPSNTVKDEKQERINSLCRSLLCSLIHVYYGTTMEKYLDDPDTPRYSVVNSEAVILDVREPAYAYLAELGQTPANVRKTRSFTRKHPAGAYVLQLVDKIKLDGVTVYLSKHDENLTLADHEAVQL